jgi:hypothetical protein
MKIPLVCLVVGFCVLAVAPHRAQAAPVSHVVYDNTLAPFIYTAAGEVGDTVTLAGLERKVTRVSVGVVGAGQQPNTTDLFRLRLWTESGPGGGRGALLWAGEDLTFLLSGPTQLISFDVPRIRVPDTFIYSVDHTESEAVYFQWANPVTVGSSPDYAWAYNYRIGPYHGTPANFMARIEAVPEPGTFTLLCPGLLAFAGLQGRRWWHDPR